MGTGSFAGIATPASARSAPDPDRVGGIDWTERTGGALTRSERRTLLAAIARGQVDGLAGRVKVLLGRRPEGIDDPPAPPDSQLARDAEAACAEQRDTVIGHSYRTWMFGRALAAFDGDRSLDEELFYVGALLHDSGIAESVAGQDFTLRSARAAAACASPHRDTDDVRRLQDAITVHITPGIDAADDGAEGYYIQTGATLDLGGLRLCDVPASFVVDVLRRHPRGGVTADILALIRAEAAAVPEGRFDLLAKTGFLQATRFAPFKVR